MIMQIRAAHCTRSYGFYGGGVVEPPLGNLEGNPRREVPTMGETDKRVDWCLRTTGKRV